METLKWEYKIHSEQANGGGSVLSFTTGSAELSKRYIYFLPHQHYTHHNIPLFLSSALWMHCAYLRSRFLSGLVTR